MIETTGVPTDREKVEVRFRMHSRIAIIASLLTLGGTVAAARAHGMSVMAGCMVETSLGISAAAHLAPLLDYADLDGAALLADDPFRGASIANGVIALPDAPGLGVTLRDGRNTSGG